MVSTVSVDEVGGKFLPYVVVVVKILKGDTIN